MLLGETGAGRADRFLRLLRADNAETLGMGYSPCPLIDVKFNENMLNVRLYGLGRNAKKLWRGSEERARIIGMRRSELSGKGTLMQRPR